MADGGRNRSSERSHNGHAHRDRERFKRLHKPYQNGESTKCEDCKLRTGGSYSLSRWSRITSFLQTPCFVIWQKQWHFHTYLGTEVLCALKTSHILVEMNSSVKSTKSLFDTSKYCWQFNPISGGSCSLRVFGNSLLSIFFFGYKSHLKDEERTSDFCRFDSHSCQ